MKFSFIDPRRYLFIKIFLWFWLTLVATISLLIFLSNIVINDIAYENLEGPKLKNLQHIAHNIERMSKKRNTNIEKIANHPRIKRYRSLYFKAENPENSFFNRKEIKGFDASLLSFSKDLQPQAIFAKDFHAFGPIKVDVKEGQYWVYEVKPNGRQSLGIKLKLMPIWLKLTVSIIASLGLSLLFSRNLIKPINSLKNAAFALADGKMKTRIKIKASRNDELAQLTNDFNKMAENLEQLMTSQKRLLADISHELRSPLTRLQMAAGLAQIQQNSKESNYLKRIEKEANTLDTMIGDVLKLSRLEVQSQMLNKVHQQFNLVLKAVLSDAKFEAKENNKSLKVIGEQNSEFSFDGQILSSALDNVLRNAIKYASKEITLELKQTHDELEIIVSDDGPGVPESDLKNLFEPFFRVSQSRQRNSGGTGLGLAICKHAIMAHKGTIKVRNQKESGLTVIIKLPTNTKDN